MLHILWMLLKFILIILGILLGLVLLAILLVLFCPVRYRAEVQKETDKIKEIKARASISWLFHGVLLRLHFQEGNLVHDFRVFGIPVLEVLKKLKSGRKESGKKRSVSASEEERANVPQKDISETERSLSSLEEENIVTVSKKEDSEEKTPKKVHKKNILKNFSNIINGILEKLKRIPQTLQKISLTTKKIYDKIEWWKMFLNHPKVKEAISFVKDDLIKLLRHIFPTRIWGKIIFGSEDPATTGTVLAILGITMPFHKNRIEVEPVFDGTEVLLGKAALKGRIYGVVLLKTALEIYFNKNVKYIIYRWKHKED